MLAMRLARSFAKRLPKEVLLNTRVAKKLAKIKAEKVQESTKQIAKSLLQEAGIVKKDQVFGENIVDITRVKAQDVYRLMDTSLEGFFQKRKMNTDNFNLLIYALSEKKDLENAERAFEKMLSLDITPNPNTYVNLIMVCAKSHSLDGALIYFNSAVEKFGANVFFYNGLLSAYARNNDVLNLSRTFQEIKDKGLKPNIANYTTLIQGYKMAQRYDLAWKAYNEYTKENDHMDEVLTTLIIKICSRSFDAEKALKIFNELRNKGVSYTTCFPYNALIGAFATRSEYADKGIEVFENMIDKKILPDSETFKNLFMATSRVGNIKKAFNGLQSMKELGLKLNKYHYTGLILTYSSAMRINDTTVVMREAFLKDAWVLFKQAEQEGMVDTRIINSLLEVHMNIGKVSMIEGAVMPLFKELQIQENSWTYRCVLLAYAEASMFPNLIRVYENIKNTPALLHNNSLHVLLTAFIKLKDKDRILDILEIYQERKLSPKTRNLAVLGRAAYLPDEIHAMLTKFSNKFELIAAKEYQVLRAPRLERDVPVDFNPKVLPKSNKIGYTGISGAYSNPVTKKYGKKDNRGKRIRSRDMMRDSDNSSTINELF